MHAVGIPAAVLGVVALFLHLWLWAIAGLLAGYVLQVLGHVLEGTEVGELMLLRKVVFPTGGFCRRLLIISLLLAALLLLSVLIQGLLNNS